MPDRPEPAPRDFIRAIVAEDQASNKHDGRVATRFPPEPNGYLHIGHAKSIVLNFGVARENDGTCNLRFDDTNPLTEDMEYVESIQQDVRWLGYEWDARFFASDYFERLYECAEKLVRDGKAYVDSLDEEEIRAYRGTVTEPGRPSPHRDRSVEENLDLLRRMRAGELPDGAAVLRAKIDMASPNMKMRDPLLYRIRHASHYRTGDDWCIYPMYDFTHCLSDAFEGITHSLCTLEFENNREIYDWLLDQLLPEPHPRQIEFARLNLSYTELSKRRLLQLVRDGHVDGWDDPRMPTLSGLRRRGVTPEAVRDFCDRIGVARADNVVDVALLEHSIRDDLNTRAPRVLGVLRPLEVVIENYPQGKTEELDAPYFPHDVGKPGSRKLPFSGRLWIEQEDFDLSPPKGFRRLAPGREVRLRYGYFVTCTGVDRDEETGEVVRLRCTYDPQTRGGSAPDGRKPAGTIHWVSAEHALDAEVRLYDRLFDAERPSAGEEPFTEHLNPESLVVLEGAKVEPAVVDDTLRGEAGDRFQFERQGYFYLEPPDEVARSARTRPAEAGMAARSARTRPAEAGRFNLEGEGVERGGRLVFNRIVTLRDTWTRRTGSGRGEASRDTDQAIKARERFVDTAEAEEQAAEQPEEEKAPRDPLEGLDPARRAEVEAFAAEHDLSADDARVLTDDPALRRLFDRAVAAGANAQAAANWIVNEVLGRLDEEESAAGLPFGGAELGELVVLIEEGTISTKIGKEVLDELVENGGSPREIVRRRGLEQVSDEQAIERAVDEAFAAHPGEAERFRGGERKLQGFFVGQVMRATRGKANPGMVNEVLKRRAEG